MSPEVKIRPVILCGGSGTRLWPLSRELYPKQFVSFGNSPSLFRQTLERAMKCAPEARPLVVCNEEHRFYALQELKDKACHLILEPVARNTAPALALAALALEGEDPLLLVLPSDHLIPDAGAFARGVRDAALLAMQGNLVAFGIRPLSPETGYGYMERGEPLANGFRVKRFVEKPDRPKAEQFLEEGGFFWNSGIFLFRAGLFLEELARYAPNLERMARKAWEGRMVDGGFVRPDKEIFTALEADSIDYAVMEKTERAAMQPLDLAWNDLGSWEALYQTGAKDKAGNVVSGDAMLENVRNCYIDGRRRLLAAMDVSDLVIVETGDAVLVAPRNKSQNVKGLVARLKKDKRRESRSHTLTHRPWGSYETLARGDRFQVKRIIVNPGAELSLQIHHHRAEHWVVVSGTARVLNGEKDFLLVENESAFIPIGSPHSLKNPGLIPLVIIEIQSGAYLEEDDILRLSDIYGRK